MLPQVAPSAIRTPISLGFWLATRFAALLFVGLLLNWLLNPTRAVLEQLDITDYRQGISTDEPSRVLTS